MKIKELLKILKEAPDKEKEVYIPNKGKSGWYSTTKIGYNFDDHCDLDLYVISEK